MKGVFFLISARLIVEEFKNQGVTHMIGVPDNGSSAIYELLWKDDDIDVITATREGEAVSIASGLYIGGKKPIVIIQNTGFLESGDGIRGNVLNMKIPLVMIIGYRGYKSMADGGKYVDSVATLLEPTLKAWDIPYSTLARNEDIWTIPDAFEKAENSSHTAAVLMIGDSE